MKRFAVLFIAVLSSCFVFTVKPLYSQEGDSIRPYGNLYVFFGYVQAETFDAGEKSKVDRDMIYKIDDDSNLGFNFSYQKYKGVFELGISDYEEGRDVKVRKAYGTYSFGPNKLTIGQDWNPYVKWSHEAANYYRSEKFGALFEEPTTQLMITREIFSGLKFYADVIKPHVPSDKYYLEQQIDNPESATDATNEEYKLVEVEREITTQLPLDNIQSMIPKMAAGCEFTVQDIKAELGAAGNAYRIKKTEDVKYNKEWIISYIIYLNSELRFGDLTANLNAGFAVNPANFGIAVQSNGNDKYAGGAAGALYNLATAEYEIKDTWNLQGYLEFGYDITKSIIIHAGAGYSLFDYPMINTERDMAWEGYLNVKFNIGGLIALTPAISYHDYMKSMDGKEEGTDIYAGVLATVSFY